MDELNKYSRIDQNVTHFDKEGWFEYDRDQTLCKDIYIYMNKQVQKDLFGFQSLDINDFCKEMGWSKNNLQYKLENPYQHEKIRNHSAIKNPEKEIQLLRDKDESFETVFENALYKLNSVAIRFRRELDNGEVTFKAMILLEELKLKKGARGKKSYGFIPNGAFMSNIANYFLNVPEQYKQIPPPHRNLYLYLASLQHYVNNGKSDISISTPTFDELQILCDIDSTEPKKIKQSIESKFERLAKYNTSLLISLSWDKKPNSTLYYQPVITVRKNNIEVDDKKDRYQLFKVTYVQYLFNSYEKESNQEINIQVRNSLLSDLEYRVELKESAYRKAQKKVYKQKEIDRRFFLSFLKKIKAEYLDGTLT